MALSNIYLLQYNNYFNRKVKRLTTPAEYIAKAIHVTPNASFNPGDGVTTQHVINNGIACDYCVVTNQSDTEIESRWFVMESTRTRNGQYQYTLKRDVIADYYNMIIDSPCYIEKATLQPNDPFIFNPEGNGFNQIKTSETLLKDHYGVPWIIGYYNIGGDSPTTVTGKTTADVGNVYETYDNLDAFHTKYPVGPYNNDINYIIEAEYTANYSQLLPIRHYRQLVHFEFLPDFVQTVSFSNTQVSSASYKLITNTASPNAESVGKIYTPAAYSSVYNQINSTIKSLKNGVDYNDIIDISDKVFKIGNKYYKCKTTIKNKYKLADFPINSGAYLVLKDNFISNGYTWDDTKPDNPFAFQVNYDSISYELVETLGESITVTLDDTKNSLKDQPWKMFAIPYGSYYLKDTNGDYYKVDGEEIAINLATDLAKTTSAVYDVQILPYTIKNGFWGFTEPWHDGLPVFEFKGILDAQGQQTNKYEIEYFKTNAGPKGFIWYPTTSSFRNTIKLANPVTITEPKIQNECDMYRLVGPNYSGGFEFSAAKNGGISQFEVNCTYLPVSPYIHINPTFGGLYGQDFDDARGLMCQGNFSISTVSDAWKNYVIQNKNFNEMFNRELENMEVNRSVQKKQEIANVIVGTLGGAVSGGTGGALVGGGIGAAIGGIAGGAASLAGGLADMKYSQQLYDESKSFKKDMRDYSLGNIRALPQTLSKTSAYNIDNKYFPFLEYYTCTDKEKQALRDQIKYTGMTVMRTGKISEFLQEDYSYVQGKMILLEEINDDTHLSMTIADEIMRGVYIK